MQQQEQEHRHDIVYFGVVNLVHQATIMGAIDVWKCRGCPEIFCEDKRYGVQDLAAEIGFPKIEPGAKWAALICTRDKGSDWTITGVKPGIVIHHSCTPETKVDLTVGDDYMIETGGIASGIGIHRVILLEKFVNSAVDVETGRAHTGPTNANQAPGKPFGFMPERSAAQEQVSNYNVFNLATGILLVSGMWAAYAGLSMGSIALPTRSLLSVAGIIGIVSGYFTINRKTLGPILGIAAGIVGIVGLVEADFLSLGPAYIVLFLLVLADIFFSWVSRARIKSIARQKWHPLDMPAYG